MRIAEFYSHLNGWEHIKVHKKRLWRELEQVIESVDAEACRTKQSKEARKAKKGLLYSPIAMNDRFHGELESRGWVEDRVSYWVTSDAELIRQTIPLEPDEQRATIEAAGKIPIFSYNQIIRPILSRIASILKYSSASTRSLPTISS